MPRPRKHTALHIVEGTYNSKDHENRQGEPEQSGQLYKADMLIDSDDPLMKRAAEYWDKLAPMAWYLSDIDSEHFAIYCCLLAEHERDKDRMQSARVSTMRSIGNDLGIGASRSKFNTSGKKEKTNESEHFD